MLMIKEDIFNYYENYMYKLYDLFSFFVVRYGFIDFLIREFIIVFFGLMILIIFVNI